MRIERLTLDGFRSWQQASFEPAAGLNILTGGNAQGKSNLLEAIFFLATARSFRTHRDREIAHLGQDSFAVGGVIQSPHGDFSLVVKWDRSEGKSFSYNREPQGRLADLLGVLPAVVFSPEDLAFVKGGPQTRRQTLNLLLLQTSRPYYHGLREYNRILAQRNAFLKEATRSTGNEQLLEAWDEQLAGAGAELMIRRRQALAVMAPWIREYHERLGSGRELSVKYRPSIPMEPDYELPAAQQAFIGRLQDTRGQEWRRRLTLSGPQRDELLLELAGHELKSFGSQGEQRTGALAWKLAEARYIRELTGERPILLLDDVYSELDRDRRSFLTAEAGRSGQAFITTTEPASALPEGPASCFEIDSGTIKRV